MLATTNRHDMAVLMNFGKYPVLELDLDRKQGEESDRYLVGGKARVAWDRKNPRWEGMSTVCELTVENGKHTLNSGGICLKSDYSVEDFVEDIENAHAPLVHKGQIVAIACYSRKVKTSFVHMMKVSKFMDPHCITVTTLEELDEKETAEVLAYIGRKERDR